MLNIYKVNVCFLDEKVKNIDFRNKYIATVYTRAKDETEVKRKLDYWTEVSNLELVSYNSEIISELVAKKVYFKNDFACVGIKEIGKVYL